MRVRQLQGNGSVKRTVVAHSEPHLAHTATSELAHELIESNDGARFKTAWRSAVHIVACGRELGKRLEKVVSFGGGVLGEQITQHRLQRKMGRRESCEPLLALRRRQ